MDLVAGGGGKGGNSAAVDLRLLLDSREEVEAEVLGTGSAGTSTGLLNSE